MEFVSPSQIYATFDLTAQATGNYKVSVKQGSQSITAPARSRWWPPDRVARHFLSVPQYVRSGRTGTIVITYTNPTDDDMVAPLLGRPSTNTHVYFSTPDDPNNYMQDAQVLAVASSGPAGILRPGQSGELRSRCCPTTPAIATRSQ